MHQRWNFHYVSIVVGDIDKAIKQYEALGVGPFPPFVGGP